MRAKVLVSCITRPIDRLVDNHNSLIIEREREGGEREEEAREAYGARHDRSASSPLSRELRTSSYMEREDYSGFAAHLTCVSSATRERQELEKWSRLHSVCAARSRARNWRIVPRKLVNYSELSPPSLASLFLTVPYAVLSRINKYKVSSIKLARKCLEGLAVRLS